ncbi:MAG: DNA polymerase III subunit delta [Lachnospiraceae bacterium]|nr:DNA polymerase III subunit delta [Lachnospiraceae bacterium]
MRHLTEDIKSKNFRQVYLLTGDQDYLRHQYRDRLSEAILDGGDKSNLSYFSGKDIVQEKIVDLAETMPFFADRRVIVIEDSGLCKGGGDVLADYLSAPCESTCFIFVDPETNKSTRLYKAIAKIGYVAEFKTPDEGTLRTWISRMAEGEGVKMEPRALALFMTRCGTDMIHIKSEMDKLISYCCMRKVITEADVKEICSEVTENRIFEMLDAVAAGKADRAIHLYNDLLELREARGKILVLMTRQFNQLLQTKLLMEKGYNGPLIAKELGMREFVAEKNMRQAAKFKRTTLRKALEECVQADEDIKTGRLSEVYSLEMLMVTLASRQKLH